MKRYMALLRGINISGKNKVVMAELKKEFDPAVYDEQVGMMEMVLDVDDIVDEMSAIRNEYCKYL